MIEIYLIQILCILNIISFIIGYIVGTNRTNDNTTVSFLKNKTISNKQNNLSIDETKIITKIDTSDMEAKYNSLGESKTTNEDISNSINKLKNMKG